MNLEGSSLPVPANDGPVSLFLHHFPCLLYEIGNRVFSHSSKKYNHILSDQILKVETSKEQSGGIRKTKL